MSSVPAREILTSWFQRYKNLGLYAAYFKRDPEFDTRCKDYSPLINQLATSTETVLQDCSTKDDTLARIILLDQYSRNIWRGSEAKKVFQQCDPIALKLSNHYIEKKWHENDDLLRLLFVLLPYQHSELWEMQIKGISIWTTMLTKLESNLKSEGGKEDRSLAEASLKSQIDHLQIIQKYGRFPHRVKVNGNTLTPEEESYLQAGGERFGSTN